MNKENLQKQIEEMKTKLADMEAELNKPEVVINYWQPEEDDDLYYVNYLGNISHSRYTRNYQCDETRYRVFKTKEEGEKYAKYVKAEETLRRVIAEVNEGTILDWHNAEMVKYFINMDIKRDKVCISTCYSLKYLPNFMYIKSEKVAEKLMKEYEAEFKTYLSY